MSLIKFSQHSFIKLPFDFKFIFDGVCYSHCHVSELREQEDDSFALKRQNIQHDFTITAAVETESSTREIDNTQYL